MTTRNSPFIDSNEFRLVTHEELNWICESIAICLKSFLIQLKTSTRRSSLKFSLVRRLKRNEPETSTTIKFTPIVHSTVYFRACFNLQRCIDSTEKGKTIKTQSLRQVKRVEWSDLAFCVLLNFIASCREIDFISTFHNFISSRDSFDSSCGARKHVNSSKVFVCSFESEEKFSRKRKKCERPVIWNFLWTRDSNRGGSWELVLEVPPVFFYSYKFAQVYNAADGWWL